jgi:hypothetical protein
MKIELFTVCDFAADYAGKLTVVGVFDALNTKQVPVSHPHWCVAAKIRFEKIEEGEKKVRFSISDADGRPVLPAIEMPIRMSVPADLPSATVNLVLNIGGIKFERFGEHSVDLAIDGRHEGSIPLFVRQMP